MEKVGKILDNFSINKNQKIQISNHRTENDNTIVQEFYHDKDAYNIERQLEKCFALLRYKYHSQEHLKLNFHLNDILILFLIESKNHKILSDECMVDIINRANEGEAIFDYIFGKTFWARFDNFSAYLNLDLKEFLEENYFTRDIKPLLIDIKKRNMEENRIILHGYSAFNKREFLFRW